MSADKIVLSIIAVLALFAGITTELRAESAIHQAVAALYFLIFTVALGLGGVIKSVEKASQ